MPVEFRRKTSPPLSFTLCLISSFTPEMLSFDSERYSTMYQEFVDRPELAGSGTQFCLQDGDAVSLGTLAALGLSHADMPARSLVMGKLISPEDRHSYHFAVACLPLMGVQGTHLAVILAHAALGTPFVVITVTATLVGFDLTLLRAAASLGSTPTRAFFKVTLPIIFPGVMSGALFAFITSFDEVVVVLFVGSFHQRTIPWKMFSGIREHISPTILAVATCLILVSILLLVSLELLRRRGEKMRGIRH